MIEASTELEALTRNVQSTFSEIIEADPVPARGAPARGRQHRRALGALPPDRRSAAHLDRGEAGAARDGRRRPSGCAASRRSSPASSRWSSSASKIQSQVGSGDHQGPAPAPLPPPADQGHPGRVRGRPSPNRIPNSTSFGASWIEGGQARQGSAGRGRARDRTDCRAPAPEFEARYYDRPDLSGLDRGPPLRSSSTEDRLDLRRARKILDQDHYDLEKIKERILEYLAVRKLKKDMKGPILCFAGPPGTGKTVAGQEPYRQGAGA